MDILLKALAGIALAVAAVGAVAVVCDIINKSNIVEKIKEYFLRKSPNIDTTENKEKDPFVIVVKEKQKDSVNVDVFFGNTEDPEIENVTLVADEIADDIKEGDWISFAENDLYAMDDEDFSFDALSGIDYDAIPLTHDNDIPVVDYEALPLCHG